MKCSELQGRLPAYVNEQLADVDQATIQLHLASCASCQTQLAGLQRSVARLQGFLRHEAQAVAPPNSAWASLDARWRKERPLPALQRARRTRTAGPAGDAAGERAGVIFRMSVVVTLLALFFVGVLLARDELGRGTQLGTSSATKVPDLPPPTLDLVASPTAGEPPATPAASPAPDLGALATATLSPRVTMEEALYANILGRGHTGIQNPVILRTEPLTPGLIVLYRYEHEEAGRRQLVVALAHLDSEDGSYFGREQDWTTVPDAGANNSVEVSLRAEQSGAYAVVGGYTTDSRIHQLELSFADGGREVIPVQNGSYLLVRAGAALRGSVPLDASGQIVARGASPTPETTRTPAATATPQLADYERPRATIQEALEAALARSDNTTVVKQPTILLTEEISGGVIVFYTYEYKHDGDHIRGVGLSRLVPAQGGWVHKEMMGGGERLLAPLPLITSAGLIFEQAGHSHSQAIGGILHDDRIRKIRVTFVDDTQQLLTPRDGNYIFVWYDKRLKEVEPLDERGQVVEPKQARRSPYIYDTALEAFQAGRETSDTTDKLTIHKTLDEPNSVIFLYSYEQEREGGRMRYYCLEHVELVEGGWRSRGGTGSGGWAWDTVTYSWAGVPYLREGETQMWMVGGVVNDARIKQFKITFEDRSTLLVPVVDGVYLVAELRIAPMLISPLDAQGKHVPDIGDAQF